MDLLEYKIDNEKSYIGHIANISKKKDEAWVHTCAEEQVVIQLILLKPSIIKRVELKPHQTEIVILQFISKEKHIEHKEEFSIPQGYQNIIPRQISISKLIVRVTLRLKARQQAKKLGLNFLILKGTPEESKNQGIQNLSKQQKIEKSPHATKHKRTDKQIFGTREKSLKKFEEQNDEGYQKYRIRTAKNGTKQDADLERVLKLSVQDQNNVRSSERNMIGEDIHEIQIPDDQPFPITYPLKPFTQQHKKVFAYTNSAWLQAQKRAQNLYNIQGKHKLSRCIQVKHFHNQSICFDIYGEERIKLMKFVEEMGAKIVDDPVDYCWLFTRKNQSEKISKGKKKNKVKMLRPEFILECKSMDAKLDENDYLRKI